MKNSVIFILVALSVCLTDCDSPLEEEIFKSNNEILNKFSVRIMVSGDCSSEENSGNLQGEDSGYVMSRAGGAAGNNTFLAGFETAWGAGDRIGIFSPQALTAPGAAPGSQNLPFTAQNSANSSHFSGKMYWGSGLHNFYAYYPYNSESALTAENSGSEVNVKVSLASNQIQNGNNSDHIGNYDFMVASPLKDITPASSLSEINANFRFHHLFSLLVFQFRSSFITGDIVSLKLTSQGMPVSLASGTTDLSQSTPATGEEYTIRAGSSPSDLSITITESSEECNISSLYTKSAKLYLVMLPGDYTSQSFTLELIVRENDGNTQTGRYTKRGIKILRGTLYTVQLNLDDFTW